LPAVLRRVGFTDPLPSDFELKQTEWRGRRLWVTKTGEEPLETCGFWIAPAEAPELWSALLASGARPVGSHALEVFRVAAGIPRYGVDIRSQDLPQETGQMQALSFTKGCYIGQEIVERIRSRGAVHRILMGFVVNGPLPSTGARVQANGKDVGEITSTASVPLAREPLGLALGYLRREFATPGAIVQIGNVNGTVSALPFAGIFSREHIHAQ
jgi:aminomethyltransferase